MYRLFVEKNQFVDLNRWIHHCVDLDPSHTPCHPGDWKLAISAYVRNAVKYAQWSPVVEKGIKAVGSVGTIWTYTLLVCHTYCLFSPKGCLLMFFQRDKVWAHHMIRNKNPHAIGSSCFQVFLLQLQFSQRWGDLKEESSLRRKGFFFPPSLSWFLKRVGRE